MVEKETGSIIRILSESTIGNRDSITLREALASDIPKGIKTFLLADTVHLLQQDLVASAQFSRIPRSTPGIDHLERTLLHSMAPEYMFDRAAFASTLESAIHFLRNYVTRPRWTLERVMFEKQDRIYASELLFNLDFFWEYPYFKKLIEGVVRRKRWQTVRVEDFRNLVATIDDRAIQKLEPRGLALLAKPIFDFVMLRESHSDEPIQLSLILTFYEDKKLTHVKDYIQRICDIRSRSDISLSELVGIIEDLHEVKREILDDDKKDEKNIGTVDKTNPQDTASDSPAGTGPMQTNESGAGGASEQAAPGDPIVIHFKKEGGEGASKFNPPTSPSPLPPPANQTPVPKAGPFPDLNELINDEQRKKFLKKIFKKDEAYYNILMVTLNKTRSWKEASLYLNELFKLNGLDPVSEEVIEFTDVVQNRFSAEQNNPT